MKVIVNREKEILVRTELSSYEEKEEYGDYYRNEISRDEFRRSFTLPTKVDSYKAITTFQDGVMEMILPKSEVSKRSKIKVK